MGLVDQFAELFQGRTDAVGGEEGRAVRLGGASEWREALVHHVTTGPAVGVYPLTVFDPTSPGPMAYAWVVKWGCVDFDIKSEGHASYDYETEAEAHLAAINLQRALHAFGIVSWIERTRSHGRHVWVFAKQWTYARDMRRALIVACDVVGVSTREVNPKSDGAHLRADQLGNYVRLPYPGGAAEGERAIFKEGGPWPGGTFFDRKFWLELALANRTPRATLERVAALWQPPVQQVDWSAPLWDELDGDVQVPKVVRAVIESGPAYGDRSGGLVYVAARCKEAGLSPDAALAVVALADEAWGKYVGRSDREARLREVVERGWT